MKVITLMDCPFCGCEAEPRESNRYNCGNRDCGAFTGLWDVDEWNKRVDMGMRDQYISLIDAHNKCQSDLLTAKIILKSLLRLEKDVDGDCLYCDGEYGAHIEGCSFSLARRVFDANFNLEAASEQFLDSLKQGSNPQNN